MAGTNDERARLLVHVKYAAAALEECRLSLHEAVALARSAGVSWDQVAEALAIPRQAALDRFRARDPADAP